MEVAVRLWMVLSFAVLGLNGCTDSDDSKSTTFSTFNYEYKESVNGSQCTTDAHTFDDLSSYCAGLKDESLNNGCAHDVRMMHFAQSCSGTATSTPQKASVSFVAAPGEDESLDVGIYPQFLSEKIADQKFIFKYLREAGFCHDKDDECLKDVPSLNIQFTVMAGNHVVLQLIKTSASEDQDHLQDRFLSAISNARRSRNQIIRAFNISGVNGGFGSIPDGAYSDLAIKITKGDLVHDHQIIGDVYLNQYKVLSDLRFDFVR
jgi:hypothetical protein